MSASPIELPSYFHPLVDIDGTGASTVHFINLTSSPVQLLDASGDATEDVLPAERLTRFAFDGKYYVAHLSHKFEFSICARCEVFIVEDGFVVIPEREQVSSDNVKLLCFLILCCAVLPGLCCFACAKKHEFEELHRLQVPQTLQSMRSVIPLRPNADTARLLVYGSFK